MQDLWKTNWSSFFVENMIIYYIRKQKYHEQGKSFCTDITFSSNSNSDINEVSEQRSILGDKQGKLEKELSE